MRNLLLKVQMQVGCLRLTAKQKTIFLNPTLEIGTIILVKESLQSTQNQGGNTIYQKREKGDNW